MLILGSTHIPAWLGGDLPEAGGPGAGAHDAAESVLRRHFSLSVAFLVDASYNPFLYFRFNRSWALSAAELQGWIANIR